MGKFYIKNVNILLSTPPKETGGSFEDNGFSIIVDSGEGGLYYRVKKTKQ